MFFKKHAVYISNPFTLYWKKNWTFQIVHMEVGIMIVAYGFGVCISSYLRPGENPLMAADKIIFSE